MYSQKMSSYGVSNARGGVDIQQIPMFILARKPLMPLPCGHRGAHMGIGVWYYWPTNYEALAGFGLVGKGASRMHAPINLPNREVCREA